MQISIKKESLQIVISDATAEECVSVLNTGLIEILSPTKSTQLLEDKDKDIIIEEDQEEHVIENIIGDEVVAPKKKLVVTKCSGCDHVSFRMIDTEVDNHKVRCTCGTYDDINITELVFGKYKCECGTTGHFLMREDVDKIYCKGCNIPLYMNKDTQSEYYIGQSFKDLMQKL